ncbi:TonB-dependent receptor [Sphingomonas sp. dw_22]|uniref:TonB-dependent receptor domain-containing protein n=1 Tax=Sphingomonas sp. dw_22 TaxID=2721175 RepID=UPI001BD56B75|nr:TonB-dependent receptor [Sphingomonas sp. dw_22]
MTKPLGLASLLLFTSALVVPAVARAQTMPATPEPSAPTPDPATAAGEPQDQAVAVPQDQAAPAQEQEEAPDVSIPGGNDIVVIGRHVNITRDTPQVVSVLSTADIARTGDGNIAGALSRVTGLSVVGNGYVYVRGLGDRYSLALLNGSPLPSPEPLKRVVPLDIFPTNVVSSSLVQKSYSVNYPGEFGGGVINLTTNSLPKESFLTVSGGVGANTFTTGNFGYVYAGGGKDWTGFDDGTRNYAPALAAFFGSGNRISSGNVDTQAIAGQLVNGNNALVQKQDRIGPNWSVTASGGATAEDVAGATLGVIATLGYSNRWTTRDTTQQTSLTPDLSQLESDFERVSTDDRIVVNGLLGLGLEFGDSKIRWTNLYVRDTLKRARLSMGQRGGTDVDFLQQDTAWYERQLIDTQLAAELKLAPQWSLDLRGGYANSKRKAPDELAFEYVRTNAVVDPYGAYFVNRLNNGNGGDATVSYSDLNEDLWSGGADLTFRATQGLSLSAGYAYLNQKRFSSRRDFQFTAPSDFPGGVSMLRPDLLLGTAIIDYYNIALIETNEGAPAFDAKLVNHAGYGRISYQITPEISLDAGVRYETAKETVTPAEVFNTPGSSTATTNLDNDYWLPAATLTWQFQQDMQVRLNASKTIARPQFRELVYQFYFDPDTNRQYRGNPFLKDSKLFNAEARYEWYFAPDQRFALAGFYKRIDNPIETFISGSDFVTSFANAPKADLYGAEAEIQKKFPISSWVDGRFFADRNLIAIANYTYTHSKLKVNADDPVAVFASSSTLATDFFRDGAPLTGQSDHLANLQLGMEQTSKLSQQTLILSYASKRVTSRGLANQNQPDVYEYPGFNLDFVVRQGISVVGKDVDLKLEARNITNRKYKETQSNGENTVIYNRYSWGTTFNFSISMTF